MFYVLFSCVGSCYNPDARDANGYERIPAVEESNYPVPYWVDDLFCCGVTEHVGYDPLGYSWEVKP